MRLFLLLVFVLFGVQSRSQERIVLSDKEDSAVRTLRLCPDSTEHDLRLDFVFDQTNRHLTVSMSSAKAQLFVFHRNVVLEEVFSLWCYLRVGKLPYKVTGDRSVRYRLPFRVKQLIPYPRNGHTFHQWLEYEGMEMEPTEFKMASDTVKYIFKLEKDARNVSVKLRYVFAVSKKNQKKCLLYAFKDFNEKYDIELKWNPCLGYEEEIRKVQERHIQATAALNALVRMFPDEEIARSDDYAKFYDTKQRLLIQYPMRDTTGGCDALKLEIEAYDLCVDSLLNLKRTLKEQKTITFNKGIHRRDLLYKARKLDELVAMWKIAGTKASKASIVSRCEMIVKDVESQLSVDTELNEDEEKAIALVGKAIEYYKKICHR